MFLANSKVFFFSFYRVLPNVLLKNTLRNSLLWSFIVWIQKIFFIFQTLSLASTKNLQIDTTQYKNNLIFSEL